MSNTTQQDKKRVPNPTGKGGFGDHPEHRNPGGWKKEDSISYQYQKLIRMKPEDLQAFEPQTVAQQIAKQRVLEMLRDNDESKGRALDVTKEVTDRIEGKAPQFIGIGDGDDYDQRAGATIVFEDKPKE